MKKSSVLAMHLLAAALAACAALLLACAGAAAGRSEPGQAGDVYEGSAMGYRGVIRVRVWVEAGAIAEIAVVDSSEDAAVGGAAMEELAELVTMYSTTDVDAVSGATESSRGFLQAVENAILSP